MYIHNRYMYVYVNTRWPILKCRQFSSVRTVFKLLGLVSKLSCPTVLQLVNSSTNAFNTLRAYFV